MKKHVTRKKENLVAKLSKLKQNKIVFKFCKKTHLHNCKWVFYCNKLLLHL